MTQVSSTYLLKGDLLRSPTTLSFCLRKQQSPDQTKHHRPFGMLALAFIVQVSLISTANSQVLMNKRQCSPTADICYEINQPNNSAYKATESVRIAEHHPFLSSYIYQYLDLKIDGTVRSVSLHGYLTPRGRRLPNDRITLTIQHYDKLDLTWPYYFTATINTARAPSEKTTGAWIDIQRRLGIIWTPVYCPFPNLAMLAPKGAREIVGRWGYVYFPSTCSEEAITPFYDRPFELLHCRVEDVDDVFTNNCSFVYYKNSNQIGIYFPRFLLAHVLHIVEAFNDTFLSPESSK